MNQGFIALLAILNGCRLFRKEYEDMRPEKKAQRIADNEAYWKEHSTKLVVLRWIGIILFVLGGCTIYTLVKMWTT